MFFLRVMTNNQDSFELALYTFLQCDYDKIKR